MSEHGHACASCGAEEVLNSKSLNRLADAAEEMVAVVRESIRIPVVFNITGKTLSDYDAHHIKGQLQRLLNPSTVRDVDLSPEVPHE